MRITIRIRVDRPYMALTYNVTPCLTGLISMPLIQPGGTLGSHRCLLLHPSSRNAPLGHSFLLLALSRSLTIENKKA